MESTKKYKDYILEKLDDLGDIYHRPMMGGYLFYYKNVLFGGIYENDNFLIKETNSNKKYDLQEELPYSGAKPMYLIEDLEDIQTLYSIIIDTYEDLKQRNRN